MNNSKAMRLNCILISVEEHLYSSGPEFVTVSRCSKCNLRLEIGLMTPQGRPRFLSKNDLPRAILDGKNGGEEFSRDDDST